MQKWLEEANDLLPSTKTVGRSGVEEEEPKPKKVKKAKEGEWTREAAAKRDAEEIDLPENPYSFTPNKTVVPDAQGKTHYFDEGHVYIIKGNRPNEYQRVPLSASKLWDYYNSRRFPTSGGGSNPKYVQRLLDVLPTAFTTYLVNFYKARFDGPLTYDQRVDFFTLDEKTVIFDHVGGGVLDTLEGWLANPTTPEPHVVETDEFKPLAQFYHFLCKTVDYERFKDECPPLHGLLKLKTESFQVIERLSNRPPIAPQQLAGDFAGMKATVGDAVHLTLEYKLKGMGEVQSLLVSREYKQCVEEFLRIMPNELGVYVPELSETPIATYKYLMGGSCDGLWQKGNIKILGDFKCSDPTIDEIEKHATNIKKDRWVLKDYKLPKSSNLWGYAFQLGVYRKKHRMNGVENISKVVKLICLSQKRRAVVICDVHLDSVTTEMVKGDQILTAIEHVDRALQYRRSNLEKMQEVYRQTGIPIDETLFSQI